MRHGRLAVHNASTSGNHRIPRLQFEHHALLGFAESFASLLRKELRESSAHTSLDQLVGVDQWAAQSVREDASHRSFPRGRHADENDVAAENRSRNRLDLRSLRLYAQVCHLRVPLVAWRPMTRSQLFAAFFFGVFLFLLYQLYRILEGFLAPLAWAALLALIFYPVQRRFARWLRGRVGLAAFALTTLVIGGVILPTLLLLVLVANESVLLYQRIATLVAEGEFTRWWYGVQGSYVGQLWSYVQPLLAQWNIDVGSIGVKATNAVSGFLMTQATAIAKNVVGFLVDFFLCTVALFFLLRDGERMMLAFRDLLPMEPRHRDLVLDRFGDALTAVVQGSLLTAVAQGTLAGISYVVLGVPFAVFLGCATALISLVPMGTPVAWGGVAIYLFATGHPIKGLLQVLWGTFVVSTIDNVIRPWIIGGRTRIPTILLFFGILGGLQVYGFLGVFLAPAVIALLVAFVRIYREEYGTRQEAAAVD